MPNLNNRIIYLTAWILCLLALAISMFFMEMYLRLEPCPLCILSRLIVAALALLFLLIVLHNPNILGQRLYALLSVLLISIGIAVSARHIWLQSLPPEQVPGCTPNIGYLFDRFPLGEALETIFNSSGECADLSWSFLGLSIPQQTLLFFIVLLFLVLFALARTFTKTLRSAE